MNRRRFLKSCIAIGILSVVPIPKKLLGAIERDDTALVQWHIDSGVPLNCGTYNIGGDIECGGKSTLFLGSGIFQFNGNGRISGLKIEGRK